MACRNQAAAGPVGSRRRCNSKKRSAARGPRLRGAKGGGRHRNGAQAPRQPTFNGYHSTLFTIHTIYKQWCRCASPALPATTVGDKGNGHDARNAQSHGQMCNNAHESHSQARNVLSWPLMHQKCKTPPFIITDESEMSQK